MAKNGRFVEQNGHVWQQICAAAFWMAQWERAYGDPAKAKEILKIAVDTGSPDLTEWQLANWQWDKN